MFIEIAAVLVALWVYMEFLYPYVIYKYQARKHKAGYLYTRHSTPFGLPVTYRLLKAIMQERLVDYVNANKLERRTFMQESTFKWILVSHDPENVKAMLATQFKDFGISSRAHHMIPVIGSGIFTQDGENWKNSRAMLRPQFTKEQISRLHHILAHAGDLINTIDRQHGFVDMVPVFHMFTMDTATEFLFGDSVNSLKFYGEKGTDGSRNGIYLTTKDGTRIYASDFVDSYTFLNDYAAKRIILGSMHGLLKFIRPGFKKHLKLTRAFLDYYVNLALESTAGEKNNADKEDESYIFSHQLAMATRDPLVIRDQCFNILVAGRDTTGSTLSFSFYYFATRPETWKKVREEVFSVFNPEEGLEQITYESLRKLKYVQMFVKEVLRLHPTVPFNIRSSTKDTTLPTGGGPNEDEPVFVPKGTSVNYSVYLIHRDKKIYGPDAEEFNPERWDSDNGRNSTMSTWGYIPFNGGPRICLGQQFALTELYLTITRLAMEYRYVEKGPTFPSELKQRNNLSLVVGGNGLPIRFVR